MTTAAPELPPLPRIRISVMFNRREDCELVEREVIDWGYLVREYARAPLLAKLAEQEKEVAELQQIRDSLNDARWANHARAEELKHERDELRVKLDALRNAPVTGIEYEAGNWSRRNHEAFFRDQDATRAEKPL